MKNGQRPRCDSSEVHAGVDVFPKSGPFTCNAMSIRLASLALRANHDGVDCGHVASDINATEALATIRRKWPLASAAAATASPTVDA